MREGLGTPTRAGTAGDGPPVSFDGVEQALYQRLYAAWRQPVTLSAAAGYAVRTEVTVNRTGAITGRRVTRPSGQPEMDQSVRAALDAVSHATPLPPQFRGESQTFTIVFRLTE